jgi:hypothetical protein
MARITLQFRFQFLQLLFCTAVQLLIHGLRLLILRGKFRGQSLLLFNFSQLGASFRHFLTLFKCLEVFGNGFQCLRCLLLLLSGFCQFLLPGLLPLLRLPAAAPDSCVLPAAESGPCCRHCHARRSRCSSTAGSCRSASSTSACSRS